MFEDDVLDGEENLEDEDVQDTEDPEPSPGDEQGEDGEERKLSRRERRAKRGRDLVAESKRQAYEAQQRLLDEQRRNTDLERRLNELEGRVTSTRKKEEEDDIDKQIMDNYNEHVMLAQSYNARIENGSPLTDSERDEFLKKKKRLDDDQYNLRFKKYGAPQQQVQQQPQEAPEVQALRQRYFDVMGDKVATAWATGQLQSIVAERYSETGVKPTPSETIGILDDIMDRARDRFKIGNRGKASDSTKRKYSGMSGDYRTSTPRGGPVEQLSEQEKSMARQFYSDQDMDEATMYKKFAKEVKGEK